MDFNETFRSINKKISRDDYCYLNETNDLDLNIFSNFGVQLDYDVDEDDEEEEERESEDNLKCNSIGLDDFRKVLILHFIGKFFRKKICVYVTNSKEKNEKSFNDLFKACNFDRNCLEIKFTESKSNDNNKLKALLKESKYAVFNHGYNLINLRQIIDDYGLNNFDSNISFSNINFEENLINCVRNLKDFYENNKENKTIPLLNLCSNSEFVSSQKAFLLSKILIENTTKNKFIIVSKVRSDVTNINEFLKIKEKHFQETTAQRWSLSSDICEANVKLMTLSSVTFDLLKVRHNSDIKLQTNANINEHDSSLLLYNCARITTILKKFKHLSSQAIYPNLPDIETINFEETLKHELEKRLCNEFLFKFEDLLEELKLNLVDTEKIEKLQIKFNIHKLCRFLFDFSKLFSSYYSKVKVLEDPKFEHLYQTMFARVYLLTSIFKCFRYLLSLYNIETPERI